MPISVSTVRDLYRRRRLTISLLLDGEPAAVRVAYDAEAADPAWCGRVSEARRAADVGDPGPLADELAAALRAWDLTDGGVPLPITAQTLTTLTGPFLDALAGVLVDDAAGGDR